MERKHFLDNIRWTVVLLVLIYHVFYLFNHVGVMGSVGPVGTSKYPDIFLYIVYPWFMAILFLIAGISARYSLERRTTKEFIKSKLLKLLVPSTLGLMVYQWIGGYYNVKIGGGLSKIPAFAKPIIFVLTGTGPLWFIQLLLLFSLLLVLIRKIDKNDRFWTICGKCPIWLILLLVVPVWGSAQILNMPIITTYRFGIYFFMFLLGYFVFSHNEVQDRVEKIHIPMLILAIIGAAGYTYFYFGQSYVDVLTSIISNVYMWVVILAILGCYKAWFNKTSAFASFMTKSSFGYYVVHYPIVLICCYCLRQYCTFPVWLTYAIALVAEFVVTAVVYEVIRRIPIIRFCVLGIKKKKKQ